MLTRCDAVLDDILIHVEFGDDDRARLTGLHARLAPQFPAIAERFREWIFTNPGTAAVLSGYDQAERLRRTLVDWMISGLLGPYDDRFYDKRSRIGRSHLAIGLPQHHMFTAINVIRGEYDDRITALYEPREARLIAKSVDKLLDIELALMLRHYQLDSESKLIARERRSQLDRVTAIQALSAGLAHEVRNPLNSAKLQLELLKRRLGRDGDAPKLVASVELVHHEIERMTRMLNEFLSFARPPALALDEEDVIAIACEVVASERVIAEARGARVELVAGDPLIARIDASKLRQILQNLVRSAIDAVATDGRIAVTIRGDAENVYLRVEDDGRGIPDAIQQRIYDPFFSTKQSGTGLGMSIVHSMVMLHGGTIDVRSSPSGTRFEVAIPRRT